jgi:metal-sulfur cluster biosynthetic enzyme
MANELPAGNGLCEDKVREQLKQVIDPELFVNIVDLGLIYVVDLKPSEEQEGATDVGIEMTMTSPMCPAGPQLVANSRQVIEALDGIGKVDIKVVMDPPWTQDMMSEDARDQLGIF